MLSTAFISLTVFVAVVAAAPQATSAAPLPLPTGGNDWISRVTPTVKLAGSPLDGQLINAVYGGFFIGRKTTIGPCADFAGCDTYSNITAINFNQNKASGSMDIDAPGGQQVYVAFAGQLAFTFPGDGPPSDGYANAFIRGEYFPPGESAYAAITFRGASWVACYTPDSGVYQVFAAAIAHKSSCIPFEMAALENAPQTGQRSTFQYATSPVPGTAPGCSAKA